MKLFYSFIFSSSDIPSKSFNSGLHSSSKKKETSIILIDDDDQKEYSFYCDAKSSPVKEDAATSEIDIKEVLRCDTHSEEFDMVHNSDEIVILQEATNFSLKDKRISLVEENIIHDENSLTNLCQDQNPDKAESFVDANILSPKQKTSLDMKSIKLTSEFQEKFQNDLTHLINDDINNLNFDDQVSKPFYLLLLTIT